MNNWFFQFDPMSIEIERKLGSMTVKTDLLFQDLMSKALKDGLDSQSSSRINLLFKTLKKAFSKKSEEFFLNHSIRVAASWWAIHKEKSYETLALSLCHNLREASDNRLKNIEVDFLTKESQDAIARLTIDRNKERDLEYLEKYYQDIEKKDNDLLILKGCDKLDNFLSYPLYNLDPYYYLVVDDFVVPRLSKRNLQLSNYLQGVADYVRTNEARTFYRNSTNDPK
jgi:hypothetical protein